MSKDYQEQAHLEDVADARYNMYQYFKELTSYERGEYDCIHGYPALEDEDNTGYYTPHDDREVDYDPIEQPEMHKRLKEVKTRLGVKQDD